MNENETPEVTEGPVIIPTLQPQPQPEPQPQPQPAYAQQIPDEPKKKGFPKALLIVLAVLAVGAAAFFGIRAAAAGKPVNKVALGIQKSAKALEKAEALSLIENVGEAGSLAVSVDVSKLSSAVPFLGEIPVTVNITSYSNVKSGKAAVELDAQIKNKSILSGTLTGSEDEVAVACEALLGKTNYSLSLKDLAKNLPKSFLDPNTDSSYAIDEDLYDWLVSLKKGPVAPAKQLAEDAKSVLEDGAKVLLNSLQKNADISKDSETISIGESDVKTNTVTVALNGKQFAAVMTDVLKWAKTDKGLKALLTSFVGTYGPVMEYADEDPDDFIDDFYDALDDALDGLGDMDKDDLDLTCVFCISKSNGQVVRAEVTSKDDYGKTVYTLEGGPDWKDPSYIALSMKDSYGKQVVTYTVEENTKSQYTAKLKFKEDSNTTATLSLSWDKSSGDLRLSSTDLNLKLTGTLTQKSKVTTLVLKKLEYRSTTIKDLGITVTLNESAKLPSISKTTEILSLDEDAFDDLVDDISDAVKDLYSTIRDAMN